jgi:hypothetical protein
MMQLYFCWLVFWFKESLGLVAVVGFDLDVVFFCDVFYFVCKCAKAVFFLVFSCAQIRFVFDGF